jgi:putative transposase
MLLAIFGVDAGYQGEQFMRWVMDTYRWILTVVKRPAFTQGFILLPKRWIVEMTQLQCPHKLQQMNAG